MPHRARCLLIVSLILFGGLFARVRPAHAQATPQTPPLFALADRTLYTVDAETRRSTPLLFSQNEIAGLIGVSPGGGYLAFYRTSAAAYNAEGQVIHGSLSDIFLLPIRARGASEQTPIPVVIRPEDAVVIDAAGTADYDNYTDFTWSPDGTRLAYLITPHDGGPATLHIFNTNRAATRAVPIPTLNEAAFFPANLAWIDRGLVIGGFYDRTSVTDGTGFRFITLTPAGDALAETPNPAGNAHDIRRISRLGAQDRLLVNWSGGRYLIDPISGQMEVITGHLTPFALDAPRESPIIYNVFANNWLFHLPLARTGSDSTLFYGNMPPAFHGERAAYYNDLDPGRGLFIMTYNWMDGVIAEPVSGLPSGAIRQLAWGAVGWRIVPECVAVPVAERLCLLPAWG
jgi:hypothetical protein